MYRVSQKKMGFLIVVILEPKVVLSKCAMSMPKIKLGSFKMCYVHGQIVQNVLCPYLRYRNSGSFKTCYVQKHGTEIIEVEV